MKIILTRSADVDSTLFAEVANFLQAVPGSVISAIPISTIKMIPDGSDNEWKTPEFDDFFGKCDGLRQFSGQPIDKDDIVVLLTGIPNDQNWFSAFQLPTSKRNIFICTEDWEYYIPKPKVHYAIAYQVVENCLQVLMDLDYKKEENHPYIHVKSRGCLNDFCGDKRDVILKIRTADICETCVDKIKEIKEANKFFPFANKVMLQVREKFVARIEEAIQQPNPADFILEINSNERQVNAVYGNERIFSFELPPLEFAVYRCILEFRNTPGGVAKYHLTEETNQVFLFFRKAYDNPDNVKAISDLGVKPNMFSQYRTRINKKIKDRFQEAEQTHPGIPNNLLELLQIAKSANGVYRINFGGIVL